MISACRTRAEPARCRPTPRPSRRSRPRACGSPESPSCGPSAWNSNVSARSTRVPTIDPATVMPFSTVWKIGSVISLYAGGRPARVAPPRRSEPKACSKGFGPLRVQWPHRRHPALGWPRRVLLRGVHRVRRRRVLRELAASRRDVDGDDRAPAMLAYCKARWPSPPTPKTATRSDEPRLTP